MTNWENQIFICYVAENRETLTSVTDEPLRISLLSKGYQRCVVLSFDEIKIQENLVFDKYTGYLIGYVYMGDTELDYSTFQYVNDLATHALVYYVWGIVSNLKFSLAFLAPNVWLDIRSCPHFGRQLLY